MKSRALTFQKTEAQLLAGSGQAWSEFGGKKPRYLSTFYRQKIMAKRQQHMKSSHTTSSTTSTSTTAPGVGIGMDVGIDGGTTAGAEGGAAAPTPKQDRSSKKVIQIEFVAALDGHSDKITCIKVSADFSVVISGSSDKTCIIWDKNSNKMVRSLANHNGGIVAVDIHKYTGHIAVLDEEDKKKGGIHIWTINGEKLAAIKCKPKPVSLVFPSIKPGLGRNVLCTGHINGDIKIWGLNFAASNYPPSSSSSTPSSTFSTSSLHYPYTLSLLRTISMHQFPVTALAVRHDNTRLVSGDAGGVCVIHDMTDIS